MTATVSVESQMTSTSPDPAKTRAQIEQLAEQAWAAAQSGRLSDAEQLYQQAIEQAATIGDPKLEVVCLTYLGITRQSQGNLKQSEHDFARAITLASANSLKRFEGHARLLLAEQESNCGQTDEAIDEFLRALEAAYNGDDAQAAESCAGNLGRLYLEKGWPEKSVEWFRQALEIGSSSASSTSWLGSLGIAMMELGQYQEAKTYYIKAGDKALADGDLIAQATCQGGIGNLHFEQGQLNEAIGYYDQALSLARQAEDHRHEGIWLGNIGNAWLRMGDVSKARDFCRQAVDLARRFDDPQAEASHLDSLGDCLIAANEAEAARDVYNQALEISKTIADRQGERIYLSNVGRAYQVMGQLQPAFDFFSKAIDLFDQQRSSIKADDLKTSFASRGQDLYRDMVKVCISMGRRVEALEYVGRAKSRALLDLLSNSPIDISEVVSDGDETLTKLVAREKDLRNQISHLERMFWQGPSEGDGRHRGSVVANEQSQDIYRQWRDVVNQLKKSHPGYASLISTTTLNWSEIADLWSTPATTGGVQQSKYLLSRETAIIELYWTDQYLLSAALWHGAQEPALKYTDDEERLANFSEDLSTFLEMSATEGWDVPRSLCQRLYNSLLAPILENIPAHVSQLLIVPHSSLYHLPFAALHDGNQFACERFAISYLPTTSLIPILARRRHEQTKSGYLISAISDYSATREKGLVFSSRLRSAAGLDDLSHTLEEAETIFQLSQAQGSGSRIVTNAEVKESLAALFEEYPIVHFAGHAVFNPDEPLASGLVLGDGSILTAASILQGSALRTRCGRLLVLSACQTGVNMVTTGGEILGLARALMYAGMPNLILSLWEVADRSTANLMRDFHEALIGAGRDLSDLDVARSLQKAQVSAIKDGQALHAWAPFVHLGID